MLSDYGIVGSEHYDLVYLIASIPDLTSHRFLDSDGDWSVKVHEPREVAERVVAALVKGGYV